MNEQRIFTVGEKMGTPIHIVVPAGTFEGAVEDLGSSLNSGAGHEAEDGDLNIDEEGGVLVAYRIPDLSGDPGTAIVGDDSFELSQGRCFVLQADYTVTQLSCDGPAEAIDRNGNAG